MSKETKHIPLWPSGHNILLAIIYAVTAESYYLLDHKMGQIVTIRFKYFMIFRQLGYVLYTFHHFIGIFKGL